MARRKCPVCGSKQWHKEPSSGLIACSEGHVLQNYRNEATEMPEDFGPHTMRKRTIKSARLRKKAEDGEQKKSKADQELYRGDRGRVLYFQCQQFILRKQINALIELRKFPTEFEIVCKDIWTLHLSLLPSPPPSDPDPIEHDRQGKDDTADSTSSSSNEDDPTELLSESDSSSRSKDPSEGRPAKKKVRGRTNRYERPASTVAVLVLACWMMRIPVMYRDFVWMIEMYELPYLDPVRLMPREWTRHLTKHRMQALSPEYAPDTVTLHKLASRLAKLLYSKYGILTPQLNAAPILWRVVKYLGGTPTLYILTKKLLRLLDLPLTLHPTVGERRPKRHKHDTIAPELGFVCAALVVLKMVYGPDGKARQASGFPNLEEYIAYLRGREDTAEAIFEARKDV